MLKLQQQPIPEEELSLVKNFLIGTLLGDIDGPFHIIERWKNYVLNNMPMNYFDITVQNIKTTTAEELQQLAKKYLNPENFYELQVV
jgi:predicted Zn-dependent peptidase